MSGVPTQQQPPARQRPAPSGPPPGAVHMSGAGRVPPSNRLRPGPVPSSYPGRYHRYPVPVNNISSTAPSPVPPRHHHPPHSLPPHGSVLQSQPLQHLPPPAGGPPTSATVPLSLSASLPPAQPPVLGWTPRTASYPGPSRNHHVPLHHPRMPPPGGGGASHLSHAAPPTTSPRLKVSSYGVTKPVGKSGPPVSPAVVVSVAGAGTPSWLKGTYRPQPPPPPPVLTGAAAIELWCKERIDLIKATIEGKSDGIRELKKVITDLDRSAIPEEMSLISSIRKEFWNARERQRKAASDLSRAECEIHRIDLQAAQVDGKINRLKSYVKFIEGGWSDDSVLMTSPAKTSLSQSDVKPEDPSKDSKPEPVPKAEPITEPAFPKNVAVNREPVLDGDASRNELRRTPSKSPEVTR